MSDTQSYKKASYCCNDRCRQGRDCSCATEYSLVNIIMMFAAATLIGAPFACWLLGVGC